MNRASRQGVGQTASFTQGSPSHSTRLGLCQSPVEAEIPLAIALVKRRSTPVAAAAAVALPGGVSLYPATRSICQHWLVDDEAAVLVVVGEIHVSSSNASSLLRTRHLWPETRGTLVARSSEELHGPARPATPHCTRSRHRCCWCRRRRCHRCCHGWLWRRHHRQRQQ